MSQRLHWLYTRLRCIVKGARLLQPSAMYVLICTMDFYHRFTSKASNRDWNHLSGAWGCSVLRKLRGQAARDRKVDDSRVAESLRFDVHSLIEG